MDYNYNNNNQYSTNYGAGGDANGGGFVGGEPQSSPAQGRGGYGKDTVRPVTIKQILDAAQPHPDADFKIDGEAIASITFVAQVRSIQQQTTNITYKLDDGTGIVEVKQWIDVADNMNDGDNKMDLENTNKPTEDSYCRVWGRLKAFNNKRHVATHVIRPITDFNEVNYHLLEATAVHLFFTRGPPQGQGQNQGQKAVAGANGVNGGGQEQYTAGGTLLPNMGPLARKVYKGLQESNQSNEGLHVQMLASVLGMPVSEVFKGAEELLSHGVIFTTIDDETWAILEA